MLAHQPRMRSHVASVEKLLDQRRQRRANAEDLAQPTFGGQPLERLRRAGDTPRGTSVRPQPVALLAGDFEALRDLFEQARDDEVGGASGRGLSGHDGVIFP